MNRYGEEVAFQNPLFVKTNWILTGCWGILYLLMSFWTCALQQTLFASLLGPVNAILPAVMGVFAIWFEKWYPWHYAKQNKR